jgi:hypothetical protein
LLDFACIIFAIFFVVPSKKSKKSGTWLVLAFCLLTLAARLVMTGGKIALIQPLLALGLVINYTRHRFRIWELIVYGLPTILVAFSIINFYRFSVVGTRGSPKSIEDVVSRVSTASDLLTASNKRSGSRESALDQLVGRDAGVDALALVLKYTPHPFPYYLGTRLWQIPLTFVPRQIWKDKPIDLPSVVFETTYMGTPPDYNGFSSIHLISDMYRNFSIFGLVGGMFCFGLLIRLFYVFCSPSRENPAGIFIYAAFFPEIIHSLEQDIGNPVVNLTRLGLLAALALMCLGVRLRRVNASQRLPRFPTSLGSQSPVPLTRGT